MNESRSSGLEEDLARDAFEWIANKSRPLGLDAAEGENYVKIMEAWAGILERLCAAYQANEVSGSSPTLSKEVNDESEAS